MMRSHHYLVQLHSWILLEIKIHAYKIRSVNHGRMWPFDVNLNVGLIDSPQVYQNPCGDTLHDTNSFSIFWTYIIFFFIPTKFDNYEASPNRNGYWAKVWLNFCTLLLSFKMISFKYVTFLTVIWCDDWRNESFKNLFDANTHLFRIHFISIIIYIWMKMSHASLP